MFYPHRDVANNEEIVKNDESISEVKMVSLTQSGRHKLITLRTIKRKNSKENYS